MIKGSVDTWSMEAFPIRRNTPRSQRRPTQLWTDNQAPEAARNTLDIVDWHISVERSQSCRSCDEPSVNIVLLKSDGANVHDHMSFIQRQHTSGHHIQVIVINRETAGSAR